MGDFSKFMKKNKAQKENAFYAPTSSLCDDKGEPLVWEFKAISSAQNETIRDDCTREVQVVGKAGQYRQKFDGGKFTAKMICACTVFPDLHNKELQDSYGVMTPEALLYELVDNAGEYSELATFVTQFCGFGKLADEVAQAKN